jgi:hypothetical protein
MPEKSDRAAGGSMRTKDNMEKRGKKRVQQEDSMIERKRSKPDPGLTLRPKKRQKPGKDRRRSGNEAGLWTMQGLLDAIANVRKREEA